jgi:hypothetical protein
LPRTQRGKLMHRHPHISHVNGSEGEVVSVLASEIPDIRGH